eukprot:augustus_masked-scaffold_24-processed-gene-0.2-mRNA-1 protein AED:0.15 eAED:0.52 QI:0/-1/0/1/-1/1/1/0/191
MEKKTSELLVSEATPDFVRKLHDMGVPKNVLFSGMFTGILILSLIIGVLYGAKILSVFVGLLQPLYYSFYALESEEKDDDTFWLTYWMVHGLFYMAENTVFLLISELFPFVFFVAKMALQVWMVNFGGSTIVYEKVCAPFLRKNKDRFEDIVDDVKEGAREVADAVNDEIGSVLSDLKKGKETVDPAEKDI